jgi:PIN domain nuclease of toxin-antitoxin system
MNLLLDTHALIWALMDTAKLSAKAKVSILDSENECYVSAISFWEILLKHSLGKLDLNGIDPESLIEKVDLMGMQLLDLSPSVAAGSHQVPRLHGDPFDRMLVHQAISGSYHLISADKALKAYEENGLQLIW